MEDAPFRGRMPLCVGDEMTDPEAFAAVVDGGGLAVNVSASSSGGAGYGIAAFLLQVIPEQPEPHGHREPFAGQISHGASRRLARTVCRSYAIKTALPMPASSDAHAATRNHSVIMGYERELSRSVPSRSGERSRWIDINICRQRG